MINSNAFYPMDMATREAKAHSAAKFIPACAKMQLIFKLRAGLVPKRPSEKS